jgi:hypothetical protein
VYDSQRSNWVRFIPVKGWVNFLTVHLKDILAYTDWYYHSLFYTRTILTTKDKNWLHTLCML